MSFLEVTKELSNGFLITLFLFFVTLFVAIPLGGIFCYLSLRKNKIIHKIWMAFTWVIRGTPLMLQIIVIFYIPGLVFNLPNKSRMLSVIFALTINYAIYFQEIYRAGLESVSEGQMNAGFTLGLSKREVFFKIILLQLIRRILPPMTNEIISLVKDTALSRVIAVSEIIMVAQKIVSTYAIIWVLFYTGVFYLLMVGIVSFLLKKLEGKLSYFGGQK